MLWSFSTQVAKYNVVCHAGCPEGLCHERKGSLALVEGQVGALDKHFSKPVTGTTPNNFRLWNIGTPLALF